MYATDRPTVLYEWRRHEFSLYFVSLLVGSAANAEHFIGRKNINVIGTKLRGHRLLMGTMSRSI